MAYLPVQNQSVSGTLGASVIGLPPVNLNVGGNPVTTANPVPVQPPASGTLPVRLGTSTDASVITVGSPVANQSVSGTVGASVVGHAPVVIVGGSVAASFTPPANQSVSGTVGSSIIGTVPVTQTTNPWITSVNGGNINVNNFPTTQNVSGSVAAFQAGTQVTSLVSTIPSSVIVGASIFGLAPVNVTNTNINVSGSVVAFNQSTNASFISVSKDSSVITVWSSPSIVGTYQEDSAHTTGDRGLFVMGVRNDTVASFAGSNGEYNPFGHDSAGRMLVKPFAPQESLIEGYASVVSTSVTTLVAAAGAGLRNYITDIMVANTGATTTLVTFRSGGGTSVLGYTIAPAGGGSNIPGLAFPLRTLANETFDFQPTSASSILFVTVKGFKAP